MKVDGDDRVGAGQFGAEDHAEADAAAADDDDGFADAHLGVVVDYAKAGRERVGEQGAKFEIKIGWNRREAVFGDDGELLKGGDVAGVDFGSVGAEVGTAAGLDAAARTPVNDDAIADLDVADFRSELADTAARWSHLHREGIPYFALFANAYNHPNDFGHGLFLEEILNCLKG